MNRNNKIIYFLKNIFIPDFLIEKSKTKYGQEIEVRRGMGLGVYFTVGGLTQSGWVVEKIWNDVISYFLKKHSKRSNIKNILILGMGGGSIISVINKQLTGVEKIDAIDIDPVIVSLGEKYIFTKSNKIKTIIIDAKKYIDKLSTSKKYDLILVDLYQGEEYPKEFNDLIFFEKLFTHVTPHGNIIVNRLYSATKRIASIKFAKMLEKKFEVNYFYPRANLMLILGNKLS